MRILTLLTLVLLAVGCKSNPYEGKPAVGPLKQKVEPTPTPTPGPSPTPTPAPTPTPTPAPTFSLQAPSVMKFRVGVKGTYIIRGSVPPPGTPQISFVGLPAGMSYDAGQEKISWTPGSGTEGATYVIEVRLKSSADVVSALVKEVVAVVESSATPLVSMETASVENTAQGKTVTMSFSAASDRAPVWMIRGAQPGEVRFTTQQYASERYDSLEGNRLDLQWHVNFNYWNSLSRTVELVACDSVSQGCATQELRLNYDINRGLEVVHPDTFEILGLGR